MQPGQARYFGWLALAVFGVVLWLSLVTWPHVPREIGVDYSWMVASGYLYRQGIQAGLDYVFTYGPLGFLCSYVYQPDLLATKLAWEIAFKGAVTLLALRHLRRMEGLSERVACALALLWLLANQSYPDGGYLAAAFLVGVLLVERAGEPVWMALGFPLLALLGLVKFTLFALGVPIALAAVLAAWAARGPLRAAFTGFAFVAALAGVWLASGQALENLPLFFQRSLTLAAGYEEAAAIEGGPIEIVLGIPLLVLNLAWIGRELLAARRFQRLLVIGLAAGTLVLSWRHGFVGSGGFYFFAFAGLLPFLLCDARPASASGRRVRRAGLAAALGLGAAGMIVANAPEQGPVRVLGTWAVQGWRTLSMLSDPRSWRAARDRELEELRARYDLPRIRARVGDESVDVFHFDQGTLVLNGLHWKPRPVPSHLTATPELARLNVEFFEGPAAPRFVLYRHEVLHRRAPLLDDVAASRAVFRRYVPVLSERWFLLLERRDDEPAEVSPQTLLERRVELGEWVDTRAWKGEPLFVRLGLRYTPLGWLRRILLRAPPLYVDVRAGREEALRLEIVRSTAAQGFLLSPHLPSTASFLAWRSGHETESVTSFRVMAHGSGLVERDVEVSVQRDLGFAPPSPNPLPFPMLEPQPDRVSAPEGFRFLTLDRHIALAVVPPTELRYRLSPGEYALDGWFGMLGRLGQGPPRRARFRVQRIEAGGAPSTLFERELDPSGNVSDRGAQALHLTVGLGEGDELVLSADAAPEDRAVVVPYWTEVRILPREPDG